MILKYIYFNAHISCFTSVIARKFANALSPYFTHFKLLAKTYYKSDFMHLHFAAARSLFFSHTKETFKQIKRRPHKIHQ